MIVLKKKECPFCEGEVSFSKFKSGEYTLKCNSCALFAGPFSSEEYMDSQFDVFKKMKKKKK